jgi:stage III sporulation protein AF
MTDFISDWIRSIAAAALVSSVALAVVPKGRVQRVSRAVCGILMIIAIISPLTDVNGEDISIDMAQYRSDSLEITESAKSEQANMSRTIIQAQLEEYILDKAANEGIALSSAAVTVKWSDDGYWYPFEVELSGELNQTEKTWLSSLLESDLGIVPERQNWSGYEDN